jgi:hypothetical protein
MTHRALGQSLLLVAAVSIVAACVATQNQGSSPSQEAEGLALDSKRRDAGHDAHPPRLDGGHDGMSEAASGQDAVAADVADSSSPPDAVSDVQSANDATETGPEGGPSGEGGSCDAGLPTFPAPQPWTGGAVQLLFSGTGSPTSLAIDSANAYTSDTKANVITETPLAGGASSPLATGFSGDLATEGGVVYWVGEAGAFRIPASGGTPEPRASASNVGGVAVDATNLYWTGTDPTVSPTQPRVMKLPHASATPIVLVDVGTVVSAGPIAVDGPTVFFAIGGAAGGIAAVPVAGGSPQTIVAGDAPLDLVASGGQLFWTTGPGVTIKTVPETGGCPVTLFSIPGSATRLAVDATNVYFTSNGSGQVLLVPRAGGAASFVPLTAPVSPPFAIAVDATNVYWTTLPEFNPAAVGSLAFAKKP